MAWEKVIDIVGPPGTFDSITVSTIEAGATPSATVGGTPANRTAHFNIPRGLPGTNAVANDSAFATYVGAPDTLTRTALDSRYATISTIDVDTQALPGDASDSDAWQRAINRAKTFNIRRVLGKRNSYVFNTPVDYSGLTDATLEGAGRDSTFIRGGAAIDCAFGNLTGNARAITFRGITFVGNAVDDTTQPQRARNTVGVSFNTGIRATGAWSAGTQGPLPTGKSCTDIAIDDCGFRNLSTGLPVYFQGVKGYSEVTNSVIDNCLDSGFIYCTDVQFSSNLVRRSRDNGVSASRGCTSVTIVNNRFENICYWGIWAAGYETGRGPERILVVGNNITGVGYGGISLDDAPRNALVSGNRVDDFYRGPVDEQNATHGRGVSVTGWPSSNLATPTDLARNIVVSNNTFIEPPRGGISFRGVDGIVVTGNTIINPGSAFALDGTTPIAAGDQSQNYGVSVTSGYASTVANATVTFNVVVDHRTTPVMNWAVNLAGVAGATMLHNTAIGNRQQLQETPEGGNTKVYNRNVEFNSRVVIGGTAAGDLRITGPALTYRGLQLQTAGSDRWRVRLTNSAEGAGNTGGDIEWVRYDNDGNFIGTAATFRRSNGQIRASYPFKNVANATGARPTAASAEAGATYFDTTLNKPVWSDGTNWRDANGTVV